MSPEDQDSREKRDSDSSSETETSEKETGAPASSDGAAGEAEPQGGEEEDAAAGAEGSSDEPSVASEGSPPVEDAESAAGEDASDRASTSSTYYDDPYAESAHDQEDASRSAEGGSESTAIAEAEPEKGPPPPPPPPPDSSDEFGDDEEGMTRMSFLEHLEELRTRILQSLYGLAVGYALCLVLAKRLFTLMRFPFDQAVVALPPGADVELVAITPVEQFHLLYIKVPLVTAIFVAAPWLMYQAWAFIAPGLYKRERRWAGPFILSTAALFILGGVFGYFVALKFAFAFLLGIGQPLGIKAMISINSYFNNFVAILLGLGVVFQMPVVIFFLTLLRIVNPGFLLRNVRYAILLIFVIAAVITPTPDVFNMIIFAAPMILLFYVGIGASYLLVLKREQRRIPWGKILMILAAAVVLTGALLFYMHNELGYRFVNEFPWFVRP